MDIGVVCARVCTNVCGCGCVFVNVGVGCNMTMVAMV